jgi:hypothetical protein
MVITRAPAHRPAGEPAGHETVVEQHHRGTGLTKVAYGEAPPVRGGDVVILRFDHEHILSLS